MVRLAPTRRRPPGRWLQGRSVPRSTGRPPSRRRSRSRGSGRLRRGAHGAWLVRSGWRDRRTPASDAGPADVSDEDVGVEGRAHASVSRTRRSASLSSRSTRAGPSGALVQTKSGAGASVGSATARASSSDAIWPDESPPADRRDAEHRGPAGSASCPGAGRGRRLLADSGMVRRSPRSRPGPWAVRARSGRFARTSCPRIHARTAMAGTRPLRARNGERPRSAGGPRALDWAINLPYQSTGACAERSLSVRVEERAPAGPGSPDR